MANDDAEAMYIWCPCECLVGCVCEYVPVSHLVISVYIERKEEKWELLRMEPVSLVIMKGNK